jgi:transcriptional regulator of acetoin/glycerol metabolism
MFVFDKAYRTAVAETWQRFIDGDLPNDPPVRREIFESWKRSRDFGVDPHRIKPANAGKAGVRARVLENDELLRASRPYMERLYAIVEGSGFYLMISDRDGVVLDLLGDEDIIRAGREMSNLVVGADRSERYAGTNAIGTSLALKAPIQIWSDEHFVKPHKIYACSAAPVRGANGAIIGCLNLTGFADKVHIHTLGMVISAADGISKEIEIHRAYADIALMSAQSDASIETIRSG